MGLFFESEAAFQARQTRYAAERSAKALEELASRPSSSSVEVREDPLKARAIAVAAMAEVIARTHPELAAQELLAQAKRAVQDLESKPAQAADSSEHAAARRPSYDFGPTQISTGRPRIDTRPPERVHQRAAEIEHRDTVELSRVSRHVPRSTRPLQANPSSRLVDALRSGAGAAIGAGFAFASAPIR